MTANGLDKRRAQKRIWGWFFFDWASQPYNTLLLTFIFGPYIVSVVGDGSKAQEIWGYGIGLAGIVIALFAPILGAIADRSGGRMTFIWTFSALYVVGSFMLWFSAPQGFNIWAVMTWFCIGLIGMEFATMFTNAMLPSIAPPGELGRISGSGWGFGYVGGLISLLIMLAFFSEGPEGKTLLGIAPIFGLDAAAREGTRAVGPLTAIWYAVFMIPFFLWVKEPKDKAAISIKAALRCALPDLRRTLVELPQQKSLFAFLGASMFYRDAVNGMYAFGGIYAAGVLNWSVTHMGIFGIIAIISGAVFAWIGGRADKRYGPKPVVITSAITLTFVAIAVILIDRQSVFFVPVAPESILPDIAFMALGAMIGAGAAALQASSRSLMVLQSQPDKMTQSFGLYALSGKATSFIAPLSIGLVTGLSGSQQIGVLPIVGLFILGLIGLIWVKQEKVTFGAHGNKTP